MQSPQASYLNDLRVHFLQAADLIEKLVKLINLDSTKFWGIEPHCWISGLPSCTKPLKSDSADENSGEILIGSTFQKVRGSMEGDKLLLAHVKCRCRSGVLRIRFIVLVVVSYVVAASCCVQMQCTAAGLIYSSLLQEHHHVDVDEINRQAEVTDDRLRLKISDTRPEVELGSDHDGREDRLMNIMNTNFIIKDDSGGIDDEMKSESVSFRPGWRPVRVQFNVLNFGALGDGVHNDTDAFLTAWQKACRVYNGVIYAPSGYTFLVYPSTYSGPCHANTHFKVDGTIIAPDAISAWDGLNIRTWLLFQDLNNFYIQGKGTFNGRGYNWWDCKRSKLCPEAPTAITVQNSRQVIVNDISMVDSQQIHINFLRVDGGHANNVTINAPWSSPNTDGIHIQETMNFVIQNCHVSTGDDCVSIVSGSHDIVVHDTYCGKGCHGISVGSLGSQGSHANVTQVLVRNCRLDSTTNGLRIKTWQGGSGIAQNFVYENIQMTNVSNPIIIDQFYCPESQTTGPCANSTSAVQVDYIRFKNITGTSASSTALKLHCSNTVPCTRISLTDLNIVRVDGNATKSQCFNAQGSARGTQSPPSCFGGTNQDSTEFYLK